MTCAGHGPSQMLHVCVVAHTLAVLRIVIRHLAGAVALYELLRYGHGLGDREPEHPDQQLHLGLDGEQGAVLVRPTQPGVRRVEGREEWEGRRGENLGEKEGRDG